MSRDTAGNAVMLLVAAPKYRRRSNPVETTCPECGYTYFRGDPDSSRAHRAQHKKRMRYFAPKPHPKMMAAMSADGEHEIVLSTSPAWKHAEMYDRAAAFRAEFGYDFVQWSKHETDPDVCGFLFTSETGAIVGACSFRLRKRKTGSRWGLDWIWVSPPWRRTGELGKRWKAFRERFGAFHVEGPVSEAMIAFLRKRGEEELMR